MNKYFYNAVLIACATAVIIFAEPKFIWLAALGVLLAFENN